VVQTVPTNQIRESSVSLTYTPAFCPNITDAPSDAKPTQHSFRMIYVNPCLARQAINAVVMPTAVVSFSSIKSKKNVNGCVVKSKLQLMYTIMHVVWLSDVLSSISRPTKIGGFMLTMLLTNFFAFHWLWSIILVHVTLLCKTLPNATPFNLCKSIRFGWSVYGLLL